MIHLLINRLTLSVIVYIYILCLKWFILDVYIYISNIKLLEMLFSIITIIICAAYISLLERQVVAVIQQRIGPSIVGGWGGLLQPISDGFKLLIKEFIFPSKSKLFLFLVAPVYTFTLTLTVWALIPFSSNPYNIFLNKEFTILLILVFLMIINYGPTVGGWASNNKYALLGAYRGIALSGSYGITIGLVFLCPILATQSFNLFEIIYFQKIIWFCFPFYEGVIFFWIVLLTEIKKVPFDVSESEAELGSGYLIEYSGFNFALFIIAEYSSILFLINLLVLCFFGGWHPFNTTCSFTINTILLWASPLWSFINSLNDIYLYSFKVCLLLIVYLAIRSILPNYRFDYIMVLHWKYLFPLLLNSVILNTILL